MEGHVPGPFSSGGASARKNNIFHRIARQMTLGQKLFWFASLCIFGVLTLVGVIGYSIAKNNVKEQVGLSAHQSVVQATEKLDVLLKSYESIARQISVNREFRKNIEWLNGKRLNDPVTFDKYNSVENDLSSITTANPDVVGVRLVSVNYQIGQEDKIQFETSLPTQDILMQPNHLDIVKYIKNQDGKEVWFPTSKQGFFGKKEVSASKNYIGPTFTLGKLIKNAKHPSSEWVLLIEIKMNALDSVFSSLNLGQNSRTYVIVPNGNVVYSQNQDELEMVLDVPATSKIELGFWYESDIEDTLFAVHHSVQTNWLIIGKVPSHVFFQVLNVETFIEFLIGLVIVFIIANLIAHYTRKNIAKPILSLSEAANRIGNGDLNLERVSVDTRDEIGELSIAINVMASLVDRVRLTKSRVQLLLDNTGQGFLITNELLIIQPEYSATCEEFFRKPIAGIELQSLLFPHSMENQYLIHDVIAAVLGQRSTSRRSAYLSLLPTEIDIYGNFYKCEFRILDHEEDPNLRVMLILTDKSQEKQLESKLERDELVLSMIVNVASNHEEVLNVIHDFEHFASGGWRVNWEHGKRFKEHFTQLMREIHTYRGTFSQFSFVNLPKKLSKLESDITERLQRLNTTNDEQQMLRWFSQLPFQRWLDDDKLIIQDTMGENFLRRAVTVNIPRIRIQEFEGEILNMLPPYEAQKILTEFRRLQVKPLKQLLRRYTEYVLQLAERMGKWVRPFEIEGESILVEPGEYRELVKSLVHLFRNMVDHGLEMPEDRLVNGKSESGSIHCQLSVLNNFIVIEIGDDGRGLNLSQIRNKIIENSLLSEQEADHLSDEALKEYIFHDGFSTRDEVSELSGRGVGMSVVKAEVDKLGGQLIIDSKHNLGTTFTIKIPMRDGSMISNITIDTLMEPFSEVAEHVLINNFELEVQSNEVIEQSQSRFELKELTTMIFVRGVIEGYFMMTLNRDIAEYMSSQFVLGDLSQEEVAIMMEEVVGECLNLILGSAFKHFPQIDEFIRMETPITIYGDSPVFKYFQTETRTNLIQTNFGEVKICLILMDQMLEEAKV